MDMLTKESKREEYNGKKEFNKVGLTLFIREILMFVSSIVAIIIYIIWLIVKSGDFSETMLDSVLNNILVNPYISIIPVMIGFIPVALFIKNKMNINSILIENRRISSRKILMYFILLLGVNSLCGLFSVGMESVLNMIRYTMKDSIDMMQNLNKPSMFIYVCIIGPIIEELTYRGMVLKYLKKFDKGFAVISSGILFGFMHGNFEQIFMAVGVGIFLGYLAEEYSVKLTIILHILNNTSSFMVDNFIDLLGRYNMPTDYIETGIIVLLIGILIIVAFKNSKKIKYKISEYKPDKKQCIYFFTRFFIILILIINIFEAVQGITAIG